MSDLQKEIDLLKARLDELEGRNKCEVGAPTVMQWQPKGGYYYVSCNGEIESCMSTNDYRLHGTERATKEQAQRAAVQMRRFNRLLALRDELCGEIDFNWSSPADSKHRVYFSHIDEMWLVTRDTFCENITPYFTTKETAQRACDMLNSGEVII